MQVKNIIQGSARIIKITDLQVGNVVKYVKEGYSTPEVKFAVVSEIMNNGEKCFIEFVSFKRDYSSGVGLEKELIAGDKDIAIFPANKEDLLVSYEEIKESAKRDISEKETALLKMKENLAWLENKIETHKGQELTEPQYKELNP